MRLRTAAALVLLVPLAGHPAPKAASPMAAAARRWLETLTAEQRTRAQRPLDDPERRTWAFVPGEYAGLAFGDMALAQHRAAHALLRAALSSHGYLQATTVMELERVLRALAQARGERADHRDPERYWLLVFGEPGDGAPWAWRLQGHHLSLSFTAADGALRAVTPFFLGANPAEVREGASAGLRALGAEEDQARALLTSLDAQQRALAVLDAKAPADILLGPGRAADLLGPPKGIAWADLREPQQHALWRLIEEYAQRLAPPARDQQLARIRASGTEQLRFAWAGGDEPGQGHYYRVHGPTVVIEYDNTQNDANHVHTVWHDPTNDFGHDVLRAHLEAQHGRDR